ncbi:MAG: HAD family hydrolase, partial [Spirochaetales bacterium]|nr:HAD family hydrolase [Spirochaetales bacterium]
DYEAARDNGVLFNPIVAGKERDSWNNVLEVSSVKFRNGTFKGEYQDEILKDFFATLAEEPHWKIS